MRTNRSIFGKNHRPPQPNTLNISIQPPGLLNSDIKVEQKWLELKFKL